MDGFSRVDRSGFKPASTRGTRPLDGAGTSRRRSARRQWIDTRRRLVALDELGLPQHVRHFDVVVVVPALAALALRLEVALVLAPRGLQIVGLPPHDGEPF